MSVFNLIHLLGFGFGATLTIIIIVLTMQKTPKFYDDYLLGIVLSMCLLWLGGNFIALLGGFLFGSVLMVEINALLLISYLGLLCIPSALIHGLTGILLRVKDNLPSFSKLYQVIFVLVVYAPVVVFIVLALQFYLNPYLRLQLDDVLRVPFYLWVLFSLVIAVIICENLARSHPIKSDRYFYRDLSISLAALGIGIIVVYIIPSYRISYVGRYLNMTMRISPSYPLAIMAYYVYRYNFYRLVIKPSLVYSIIYGTVMAIYLLGIRRLGEYLKQYPEVNSEFIEGILLIALVFAFQPFRQLIQNRLDRIFFRDRHFYQQVLRELSDAIIGIVDLEKLLTTISDSLSKAFKSRSITIVVFQYKDKKPEIYKTVGHQDFNDFFGLVRAFMSTRKMRLRQQIKDMRVVRELEVNNLELAVPVFYQKEIMGMICLEEKQTGIPYSENEIDMLQTFANQIGLAVENARLVQERLNLEARVYQAEKLNSLGQLATTMSHEIKNPLSSINSIIQVLHESAQGEEQKDLEIVLNEIQRLNNILKKLLTFSKPTDGTLDRVSLREMVQDVISLLKFQANKYNISIKVNDFPDHAFIYANNQSVREVIFNLVLNAMQSIDNEGHIELELEALENVKPLRKISKRVDISDVKKWYCLTVLDDGPGITKANLRHIFDPFFTTKSSGSGLGLSIVKKNVEDFGGFIQVKSQMKKGTAFCVYFPVHEQELQNG